MKKILVYLFVSVSLMGCKDKSELNESQSNTISVVVKNGTFSVQPKWKYVSDKSVDCFHTKNIAYWIDEKKIQVLDVEKSKTYETGTFEVDGSEWTYSVNSQEADINRGRVCFAEVAFFTCNDGSVVQRTYMSNVVKAPNKPLQ
jgi:hypothetical protein